MLNFISLTVLAAVAGALFLALNTSVLETLRGFTSVSTRFVMLIASVMSSVKWPMGSGPAALYLLSPDDIAEAVRTSQTFLPIGLDYSELASYGYGRDDSNVGTKSYFFEVMVAFGLPFVALVAARVGQRAVRVVRGATLLQGWLLLSSIIAVCTYVDLAGNILIPICLGLCFSSHEKG
jgi:hypothetical protein